MGFMISTMLLLGTNGKSHGQNSGTPAIFLEIISKSVPSYLHLAVCE